MREGPPSAEGEAPSPTGERPPWLREAHQGGGPCELRPFSALGKQEGPMEQEGSRRGKEGAGWGGEGRRQEERGQITQDASGVFFSIPIHNISIQGKSGELLVNFIASL